MELGKFFPATEKFFEIRTAMTSMLERVVMEGMDAGKAVEMYQAEIDKVLGK